MCTMTDYKFFFDFPTSCPRVDFKFDRQNIAQLVVLFCDHAVAVEGVDQGGNGLTLVRGTLWGEAHVLNGSVEGINSLSLCSEGRLRKV